MSVKFARYAKELLRFNEAGVEVVVMAYLRSIFIPRVLSALDCNIMSGCKEEMGKVSPVPFTICSANPTELKRFNELLFYRSKVISSFLSEHWNRNEHFKELPLYK